MSGSILTENDIFFFSGLFSVSIFLYWDITWIFECEKPCPTSCWWSWIDMDR